MTLEEVVLIILSGLTLISALGVIALPKALHSVFALVLVFLGVGGIFMTQQAVFLGFVVIIVYVGAVAVFFLFAVMQLGGILDMDLKKPWGSTFLGMVMGAGILMCLGVLFSETGTYKALASISQSNLPLKEIAHLLYTRYGISLQITGLLLLVGIVGGVTLLKKPRRDLSNQHAVKDQDVKPLQFVKPPLQKGTKDV